MGTNTVQSTFMDASHLLYRVNIETGELPSNFHFTKNLIDHYTTVYVYSSIFFNPFSHSAINFILQ